MNINYDDWRDYAKVAYVGTDPDEPRWQLTTADESKSLGFFWTKEEAENEAKVYTCDCKRAKEDKQNQKVLMIDQTGAHRTLPIFPACEVTDIEDTERRDGTVVRVGCWQGQYVVWLTGDIWAVYGR